MKGKRIIRILLLLTALSTAGNAMAAVSKTANVVTQTEGIIVENRIETADDFEIVKKTAPEVSDAIVSVNKGEIDMSTFVTIIPENVMNKQCIEELENKDFVTGFFDVSEDGAKKNDNGSYTVVLTVPSLTSNAKNVRILHYVTDNNEFEIIEPKQVDYDNKQVVFEVSDFSPFAVVAEYDTSIQDGDITSPQTGNEKLHIVLGLLLFSVVSLLLIGIRKEKYS